MNRPDQGGIGRRGFLTGATAAIAAATAAYQHAPAAAAPAAPEDTGIVFALNGHRTRLTVDPWVTLLDAVRERLELTGTKKGCDRGQCGACTVHVDGRRVLSCLTLAATVHGKRVTTIEGLAQGDRLHPMQEAFVDCDGLQCGFCTPGQVMSAVALVQEGHTRSAEEIREHMSGNLCRCGAYPAIVDAVQRGAS